MRTRSCERRDPVRFDEAHRDPAPSSHRRHRLRRHRCARGRGSHSRQQRGGRASESLSLIGKNGKRRPAGRRRRESGVVMYQQHGHRIDAVRIPLRRRHRRQLLSRALRSSVTRVTRVTRVTDSDALEFELSRVCWSGVLSGAHAALQPCRGVMNERHTSIDAPRPIDATRP